MTEQEYSSLVRQYTNPVFRFVRRMVSDDATAEDITQDAFIKAWHAREKFNAQKKFSTWIFQIAKNTAIDALRRKKATPFSSLNAIDEDQAFIETIADDAPLPDVEMIKEEDAMQIRVLLEVLPAAMAQVIQLHLEEDLTFGEISEVIGEPLDTVKSRYRRALLRLRKHFAPKNHPRA